MAQKITEDDVRKVATLSRLKLREEQVPAMTAQLAAVLGYIDKLAELDVEKVEPMAHPTDMTNRFREDVPSEPLPVDAALANAPETEGPYFKVPKVIGEGPGA